MFPGASQSVSKQCTVGSTTEPLPTGPWWQARHYLGPVVGGGRLQIVNNTEWTEELVCSCRW